MSTSSNNWQKKGKDGMGNAGKRKEMVKDWHVPHMYVDKLYVDKLCGQVVTSCVDGHQSQSSPISATPATPK